MQLACVVDRHITRSDKAYHFPPRQGPLWMAYFRGSASRQAPCIMKTMCRLGPAVKLLLVQNTLKLTGMLIKVEVKGNYNELINFVFVNVVLKRSRKQ